MVETFSLEQFLMTSIIVAFSNTFLIYLYEKNVNFMHKTLVGENNDNYTYCHYKKYAYVSLNLITSLASLVE